MPNKGEAEGMKPGPQTTSLKWLRAEHEPWQGAATGALSKATATADALIFLTRETRSPDTNAKNAVAGTINALAT